VLATTWAATQWTAWRLGYQLQLGTPWAHMGGLPLYALPAFYIWWYWFDAYAPRIFIEGAVIASSGGFAAIVIAIGMSVWRAREARESITYGSARWAKPREVRGAGLFSHDGVILGRLKCEYLRHDGPEHVLCFAPTRSGKGVGLVVPTLLTWAGSSIVHDIKGENFKLTAGWRSRFGRVLLFDPTNPLSSAYNPLVEVRRGDTEVRDVQNVADILVDPEGALERRNHWEKIDVEQDAILVEVAVELTPPALRNNPTATQCFLRVWRFLNSGSKLNDVIRTIMMIYRNIRRIWSSGVRPMIDLLEYFQPLIKCVVNIILRTDFSTGLCPQSLRFHQIIKAINLCVDWKFGMEAGLISTNTYDGRSGFMVKARGNVFDWPGAADKGSGLGISFL
jgi:hypothetical protein